MSKKKKKSPREFQSFMFLITSKHLGYSFGLDKTHYPQGPYSEHANLEIQGHCSYPPKLRGEKFTLRFLGNRNLEKVLNNDEDISYEPLNVGKLTRRGDTRNFLGSLSFSVIWKINDLIDRNKIDVVDLKGTKLRYGSSDIWHVSFYCLFDIDEDDYL